MLCFKFRARHAQDSHQILHRLRWSRVSLSLALLILVSATSSEATAGEFNPTLNIGDPAPAWTELPGVDGKPHSLDSLKASKIVVVAFTCNSCSYAVDCEDRLVALAKQYETSQVAIVAINVNKVEEDRLPAMKQRATEKGFAFPYVYDETQKVARDYGALYTPTFFVLNQNREVAYMGSMDDSPDGSKIERHYVKDAIAKLLQGDAPEVTETVPIGCRVRYERQRRKRTATSDS